MIRTSEGPKTHACIRLAEGTDLDVRSIIFLVSYRSPHSHMWITNTSAIYSFYDVMDLDSKCAHSWFLFQRLTQFTVGSPIGQPLLPGPGVYQPFQKLPKPKPRLVSSSELVDTRIIMQKVEIVLLYIIGLIAVATAKPQGLVSS